MLHTIENERLSLTVNTAGAELWELRPKGRPGVDCLWDGKEEIWPRRAPVCFPWCGKIQDNWYQWGDKRYQGGQHGFVRDMEHTLREQGEDCLAFSFHWPGNEQNWPWAFSFETRHQLWGNRVLTTCTAVNGSSQPMPVQLGFHTGLRCPFREGGSREDYLIRFELPEAPDGSDLFPLGERTFENDSICFENLASSWIQVEERQSGQYLRLDVKGWPYVLLWSKLGVPGYVCIEPWTGYKDDGHDLAARPGALLLGPGESLSRTQRLTVKI